MNSRFFCIIAWIVGIVGSFCNVMFLSLNAWLLFFILESVCVTISISLYKIGSLIQEQSVLSNQISSLQDSLKKLNAEFYARQTVDDEKIVSPEPIPQNTTDSSSILVRCPYCGRIYEKNPFGCIFCHNKG